MNLHMPATAVAEHLPDGARHGKVHRTATGRPAAPKGRNRRRYRIACGRIVAKGFPVRLAPPDSLCGHCWPTKELDKAGVAR